MQCRLLETWSSPCILLSFLQQIVNVSCLTRESMSYFVGLLQQIVNISCLTRESISFFVGAFAWSPSLWSHFFSLCQHCAVGPKRHGLRPINLYLYIYSPTLKWPRYFTSIAILHMRNDSVRPLNYSYFFAGFYDRKTHPMFKTYTYHMLCFMHLLYFIGLEQCTSMNNPYTVHINLERCV